MLNQMSLIGNLGGSPELRHTNGGAAVCNFQVATTEKWKDKQTGEARERTEWHRIVVWNGQAEACAKYLAKGRQVYIQGKLQTRQWEDKAKVKHYTTEIMAREVTFLGKPEGKPAQAVRPEIANWKDVEVEEEPPF